MNEEEIELIVTGAPSRFRPIVLEGLVLGDLSLCWICVHFNVESQGAERVQEVLDRRPRGLSYSQGCLRHLSHGFKGAKRIFLCGVSLQV